jgi:L-aspartate oxidase
MAPQSVSLISKTSGLSGGSSYLAQGGIAAAVGPGDSAAAHAEDTLIAGAGLSDPGRTRQLADEGASSLSWLVNEGIKFDRNDRGELELAKEAAHRFPRVVHAGGDATGSVLVQGLIERVAAADNVSVYEDTFALQLIVRDHRVLGVITLNDDEGWIFHRARNVVLCTGGIGQVWWHTTNPSESTGDGLAMAARAGARLADMEFVQFHPTALKTSPDDGSNLTLLTEALRGAGATLLDESGYRFMCEEHELLELAPRDVVARAIQKRTGAGKQVFLDLRPIPVDTLSSSFPQAVKSAAAAGLDPYCEPLPVVAAAHYHMGGVQTDNTGRTSKKGLWACGEVATTGIHGANRLASNSLLESVAYARRIAAEIRTSVDEFDDHLNASISIPGIPVVEKVGKLLRQDRKTMTRHVAILRGGSGMEKAYQSLCDNAVRLRGDRCQHIDDVSMSTQEVRSWCEAKNLNLVARLVTMAALRREESRGAHFRGDFPVSRPEWCRKQSVTATELVESH